MKLSQSGFGPYQGCTQSSFDIASRSCCLLGNALVVLAEL